MQYYVQNIQFYWWNELLIQKEWENKNLKKKFFKNSYFLYMTFQNFSEKFLIFWNCSGMHIPAFWEIFTPGCHPVICQSGYEAGPSGQCIDIDECEVNNNPCNPYSEECRNTLGSFECLTVCAEGRVTRFLLYWLYSIQNTNRFRSGLFIET